MPGLVEWLLWESEHNTKLAVVCSPVVKDGWIGKGWMDILSLDVLGG